MPAPKRDTASSAAEDGGVEEDVFLARIRDALRERGPAVELPDVGVARVVEVRNGLADRFAEMATAAGMTVHRVAGADDAAEQVIRIARAAKASWILLPPECMPARREIVAAVEASTLRWVDPDSAEAAFEADVGVTGVRMAVAETGSLVLETGPQARRLASLAVDVHVALVREDQIVPDLLDWALATSEPVPAGCVLVTGPSKTADIELNLVTGVHGPGQVDVIVLPPAEQTPG